MKKNMMSRQVGHEPGKTSTATSVSSGHTLEPDFGQGVAHLPETVRTSRLHCHLLASTKTSITTSRHFGSPWVARLFPSCGMGVETPRNVARVRGGAPAASQRGHWCILREWLRAILANPRREGVSPLGMTDSVWLRGAVQFHMVESRQGMAALGQLMIHFAGPGVGEPYSKKYAALSRSLGIRASHLSETLGA